MTLPVFFRNDRERILANFDYTDIASGVGYENYYLILSRDSIGVDYKLTSARDYSYATLIACNSGNSPLDYDYDFSTFSLPRTINGDVRISVPLYTAAEITPTFTFELYKWDGATETQLGSTVTYAPTINGTSMAYMIMPIVNELIKKGETIRLRVTFTNATGTPAYYGTDPANRSDSDLTITTTSKISIPYKIDL